MTPTELRSLFPSVEKGIHLNHAGVSPIARPVADAVSEVLSELTEGNPLPAYMNNVRRQEELRGVFARMLNAPSQSLSLIKNTSQGLAIIAQAIPFQSGDNVVVCSSEYPSNVYPWMAQETRGVTTKLVTPGPDGIISEDDLEAACDASTRVLAVSWIQWGTGQRMDLPRLGAFCREHNILLAVDAVQGLGAMRLDLSTLPDIGFVAAGGHKWLLAPGGVGVMYVRPDLLDTLVPTNVGWNWVEKPIEWERNQWGEPKQTTARFEEGTPNVLGIAAMLASVRLLEAVGFDAVEKRVLELATYTRQLLTERGMHVVTPHGDEVRSGIIGFRHPVLSNEEVEAVLAGAGVASAVRCGNVRFAPHVYSTEEDIARAVAIIP